MSDPTQRFSDRVGHYVRHRPGYPAAILEALTARTALGRGDASVADLGSGTGLFTALLLPHARRVHAVEPNAAMRAAAEAQLGGHPAFASVAGTAEATTLPGHSVDLVVAAQAFHWFEPTAFRRECARILRPGGHLALVWNERETDTTPFLRAYEAALRTHAADYARVRDRHPDQAQLAAFFAPAPMEVVETPSEQSFDLAGFIGRALSSSYAPNETHPAHTAFRSELERIFGEHAAAGRVRFRYRTRLHLGRLA